MRNYIILNNKNSNTISGLIIQELAPISKPQQRTQVETIDGRDGDIVTPLGYAAYNKKIKIGLYGDFDINEIIAYFATQGTAIFSNEPDKYYNYQIVDQIDYERLVRYKVATVTMHVQPFKYSATEGTITVDASDTVSGEGSEIALNNTAEAPFTTLRHKGNATQTTYSGKNLLQISSPTRSNTRNGVTITLADDGKITLNGTATSNMWPDLTYGIELNTVTHSTCPFYYTESTTVFSVKVVGGTKTTSAGGFWLGYNDNSAKQTNISFADPSFTPSTSATNGINRAWLYIANGSVFDNYSFYLQVEKGSTATSFEPYVGGTASPNPDYPQDIKLLTGDSTITIDDGGENNQEYVIPFGDTYLAAIGDYADEPVKVGDTWYIRRAVGKVVLDGTESGWTWADTARYAITTPNIGAREAISDHFTYVNYTGHATTESPSFDISSNLASIGFHNKDITSLNNFKTWLASNPTTVYYALATPTDEEITDQALIDALDDFYEQAHAYKSHTHITATAADGNAPAVLSVEVGEDNESTVTNAGNTTSRPIITIYGQGNIGMYINDVQVLDIALGDEQYITIDSVAMEAYKDTTENLKNRLVTGDYNKLALNAGANKIYFTGNVTKYEISKYSRWL